MRGSLETIVGAMFAGKTSELLKRILWAKHQNKKIVVIKPSIDNRYSQSKIITHNDLSHECFAMKNWDGVENLRNIKNRTLIIWGDLDKAYNYNQVETLKDNINNSILKIINGCSHNVHLEKPDEFNDCVNNFLKKN